MEYNVLSQANSFKDCPKWTVLSKSVKHDNIKFTLCQKMHLTFSVKMASELNLNLMANGTPVSSENKTNFGQKKIKINQL